MYYSLLFFALIGRMNDPRDFLAEIEKKMAETSKWEAVKFTEGEGHVRSKIHDITNTKID